MYFELLTAIPLAEVEAILAGHPKQAKVRLAKEVIAGYHSAEQALEAADRWQREVSGGELPSDIPTVSLSLKALAAELPHCADDLAASRLVPPQLLKALGLTASTSEASRLIQQGSISIIRGDQTSPVSDPKTPVALESGMLVKAGKKRIVRLWVSN